MQDYLWPEYSGGLVIFEIVLLLIMERSRWENGELLLRIGLISVLSKERRRKYRAPRDKNVTEHLPETEAHRATRGFKGFSTSKERETT